MESTLKAMAEEPKPAKVLQLRPAPTLPQAPAGGGGLLGEATIVGKFNGPRWRVETSEGGTAYLSLEHDDGSCSTFQLDAAMSRTVMGMLGVVLLEKNGIPPKGVG